MADDRSDNRGGDAGAERDLLRIALERYDAAWTFDQQNREDAVDDLRFAAGEQWPESVLQAREAEGRPVITENRIKQFIRQVTGDARKNKPAITVRPVGGGATEEVAEIMAGLIRDIEQRSGADTAYQTALQGACMCGMGWWRITTEYSHDDTFEQDIRIRRIANPFDVVADPLAREWTLEDARFAFVTERIPYDDFKARFPEASCTSFEEGQIANGAVYTGGQASWFDEETVRVAEYWVKRPKRRQIALLADGTVIDLADDKPDELRAPIVQQREVESFEVVQYLISGAEVLEGPNRWPGRFIPLIRLAGEEIHIGDRINRAGMVRDLKGPQQVLNFMRSAAVETVAMQPKAPWLATTKQVGSHLQQWRSAHQHNYPVLLYDADPTAPGPPQRQLPPQPSAGFLSEVGMAAEGMKAVSGIYDASLGAVSNEKSGRAILARQQQGDTGTFVYIDNLGKAIEYTGRQIVDLIPHIYDTQRVLRVLHEDGTEEEAPINQMQLIEGVWRAVNDLSVGRYSVTVTVGPSYATKRLEAADSMLGLLQALPPQAGIMVADLLVRNLDWPGAAQIAERLQKLLPPGIDEEGPPQPPPPDPKMVADAAKAAADAEYTKARAEGQQLDNVAKGMELQALLGGINQAVAAAVQQALPVAVAQALQSLAAAPPPASAGIPPAATNGSMI